MWKSIPSSVRDDAVLRRLVPLVSLKRKTLACSHPIGIAFSVPITFIAIIIAFIG